MKARNFVWAMLPFLATCSQGTEAAAPPLEAQAKALGTIPPSEVAAWRQVGSSGNPDGRFLQAAAFDEKREVVVLLGGATVGPSDATPECNQDLWEWSLATGQWTRRTGTGPAPSARAGAAMAYDSTDNLFVLFGGRSCNGVAYQDTWEWNPTSGAWTERTSTGARPSARSQHGMVYQRSTGRILLFGGGTSNAVAADGAVADGTRVSTSLKDTWEYDPVAQSWTDRSPSTGPGPRHDLGLVWDATRNRAILVGGLQITLAGATPVPKQDTWEWDPAGPGTWTDRTAAGPKPSPRYGHAMAYDGSRKKIVLFGGWNIDTSGSKNDLWEWDPTGFAWTQRLSGSEGGLPAARTYASLVADNATGRLELVAGAVQARGFGIEVTPGYYASGSNEVWDLDTTTLTFTDRTAPQDLPIARSGHVMAYNPSTRRVYLFGGDDPVAMTPPTNDLWEWDGKTWTQVVTDKGPPGVVDAGMAYDPVRKSLILYGGYGGTAFGGPPQTDTWEWDSTARQWTKLNPASNPGQATNHRMVTDTARGRILLFPAPDNHVWEWDGSNTTWTDRTLISLAMAPLSSDSPVMAYDEGRRKLFLYGGWSKDSSVAQSTSAFWEWDPITAGWSVRDPGDALDSFGSLVPAYDSIRQRVILLTDAPDGANSQTWELEAKALRWYVRTLASQPPVRSGTCMAFDAGRGVAVLFGGAVNGAAVANDTWEYKVTDLGSGEGCTADFATLCASGNCVDGVCCDTASCTGNCKSCNVPGSEGTCKLAPAGTEVSGSCGDGQACDAAGACKSKNGQSCGGSATCASGYCVDGICCDSACTGACVACNLSGRTGTCSPYPAGTDPESQCTVGTGACKSTCDGVGACGFPDRATACGTCTFCDGKGQCSIEALYCSSSGGTTGTTSDPGKGGAGGSVSGSGGRGTGGTGGNSTSPKGGSGGTSSGAGGTAGSGGSISTLASGSGGAGGSAAGSAGASQGGGGGLPTAGSGGSSGRLDDGGTASRDSGRDGVDPSLTVKLTRSGCSCAVGGAQAPRSGLVLPFALVTAALLASRLRRRRR